MMREIVGVGVLVACLLMGCGEPGRIAHIRSLAAAGDGAALAAFVDADVVCLGGGEGAMGAADGDADESPVHVVDLGPFCIGRFEVTNAQYAECAAVVGLRTPPHWVDGVVPDGTLDFPVVGLGWDEADAYCRWAGGRLPSEAEWERACGGEASRRYPWGDVWDPGRVAITGIVMPDPGDEWPGAIGEPIENGAVLQRVGSLPMGDTPEGIADLGGNASEWTADWYDRAAYSVLQVQDPVSQGPTWSHVIRGGAWFLPSQEPDDIAMVAACSARNASHTERSARIGFRCVFAPEG